MKLFSMIALATMLGFSIPAWSGELAITNLWIREAPPGTDVLAGYLTISNHSPRAATLTTISSEAFGKIELHKTEVRQGISRMIRQDRITIAAGSAFELQPGAVHLMLKAPRQRLQAGERIKITFTFDDRNSIDVAAEIRKGEASDSGHHHAP